MSDQKPQMAPVGTGDGLRDIAVLARGGKGPAVIWLGGFRSDMRATKATHLDEWGARTGRAVVRFDYSGHGESPGDFADGTIGQWLDDALAIIERFGGDAPVLVGSSMGGWLALLAARHLQEQGKGLSGLVLIAPAVDFTDRLMWDIFPQDVQDTIMAKGQWLRHSHYSPDPYPITRRLIEEGRNHLLMGKSLRIDAPIHILQGTDDPDVPMEHVLEFAQHLAQDDVTLTLVQGGDHRLSRPEDLEALVRAVEGIAV
jgi:pimeloyl-ACP methyl ester carboxylesterase